MPAVGQQDLGPEPIEDLLGEVEERRRLDPVGGPLDAAEGRGQQRDPDASEYQIEDVGPAPRESAARTRWIGTPRPPRIGARGVSAW